jgi:hypothetical protein
LSGKSLKDECYIPLFADWVIKKGSLKIREVKADSEWFGVTYQEDRLTAQARIAGLIDAGVYPPRLWG